MKTLILFALILCSQAFADEGGAVISGGKRGAKAIVIHFTSIGRGVDVDAQTKIEALIASAKTKGDLVDLRTKYWGREGESTVCAEFKGPFQRRQLGDEIDKVVRSSRDQTTRTAVVLSCSEPGIGISMICEGGGSKAELIELAGGKIRALLFKQGGGVDHEDVLSFVGKQGEISSYSNRVRDDALELDLSAPNRWGHRSAVMLYVSKMARTRFPAQGAMTCR